MSTQIIINPHDPDSLPRAVQTMGFHLIHLSSTDSIEFDPLAVEGLTRPTDNGGSKNGRRNV